MPPTAPLRPARIALQQLSKPSNRSFASSTSSTPATSPFAPRHFLSIADLTPAELSTLVRNASSHKTAIKSGSVPKSLLGSLNGKTVAMMYAHIHSI